MKALLDFIIDLFNIDERMKPYIRIFAKTIMVLIILLIIVYTISFYREQFPRQNEIISSKDTTQIIKGKNINNAPNYGIQHIGDNN